MSKTIQIEKEAQAYIDAMTGKTVVPTMVTWDNAEGWTVSIPYEQKPVKITGGHFVWKKGWCVVTLRVEYLEDPGGNRLNPYISGDSWQLRGGARKSYSYPEV
jgi:hypothetical protein